MKNTSSDLLLISSKCFTVYNTQASRLNFKMAASLSMVLTILTVLLNLTVSLAFIRLKKYKKVSDVLLLTLTGVHLIGGLFHIPLMSMFYMRINEDFSCLQFYITEAVGYSVVLVSFANILFISIDMYINIVKPMLAEQIRKRFFLTPMALLWVFLTTITFVFQVVLRRYNSYFRVASGAFVISIYLFAVTVQFKVYRETTQLKSRDASLGGGCGQEEIKKALRRIYRVAKAIIVIYSICYVPYVMLVFYEDIFKEQKVVIRTYVKCWVFSFASVIHVANPMVYCLRLKTVRRKIIQLLHLSSVKNRRQPQPQTQSSTSSSFGKVFNRHSYSTT